MVQIEKQKGLHNIVPKELIDATYEAAQNFQLKAFFEAKEEILKAEKYSEQKFYEIYDAMLDAETERKIVLKRMLELEPLFLNEIIEQIREFPPGNVIRDVIYLKEQGYVEEIVDIKTKTITKKIKGEEKEVEQKEYFYRYHAKSVSPDFQENYFKPVTVVYDSGACCQCGWCSSICPVDALTVDADSLKLDEDVCMKCGLCFTVCPRSFSMEQAHIQLKKLDKKLNWSDKIGAYINTYTGTTTNKKIEEVRQDGGVVTSLLHYLLKNKMVDAIVAVEHSSEIWKPEPVIIEKIENLYNTGGTKYANSPSLTIIEKTTKFEKIAFVGVPCMMKAIEKARLFPSGAPFFENIEYTIGLFCMESFPYEGIIQLAKEQFDQELEEISKMDIGGGKFIITLNSGEKMDVPLKNVQSYARSNCHFCEDLTSDFADISVGSIGSQAGWSSIITRSKKGEALVKDAIKAGIIETKPLKDVKPGQFLVEKIAGIKRNKCKPIELNSTNND
ncbi:MAG: 4Fe-4S dicluster domain-containing protein [Promethearchaeota archaeon]|nr:MAG: 4Fe-4S dicluster domain-containing protein [Candidatus Lokiarchaeota archaeon]